MGLKEESIELHKKLRGKIEVNSKMPIDNIQILSRLYTPGVAEASREIAKDKKKVYDYTSKWNSVAIVTDGSRLLGLGDIGPEASMPVMEGKAVLFKIFGNVDAFPICLATKNTEEIISTVKNISPTFGGINIEDIDAPRCFDVVDRLDAELDIPVFHDDQHGTGIVATAALMNAAKIVDKGMKSMKVVIAGAGAAGIGITKVLNYYGVGDILLLDSKGLLNSNRTGLDMHKTKMLQLTNKENVQGGLKEAVEGADVLIGVSGVKNLFDPSLVKQMNDKPIVFALTNPDPEIEPDKATNAGAAIVATGSSQYANQINNSLVFPGLFRGTFDSGARKINKEMHIAVIEELVKTVPEPSAGRIVPQMTDNFVGKVSTAVAEAARKTKVTRD